MVRRLRNEDGFTLIELVVSMGVAGILLAAASMLVQVAFRTQVDATARVEGVQKGRSAVNEITRVLKAQMCFGDGSPAFLAGSDTSVRLYTSVNTAQADYQRIQRRQITFVPNATGSTTGRIDMTTEEGVGRPPDVTGWGAVSTRTIADDVQLITGTPLFRFYTFTGNPADATLQLSSPLSAGDLYRVVRVDMAFQTTTNRISQPQPLRFANSVTARTADPDAQEGTLPC